MMRNRLVGAIIILGAAIALAVTLITSYQQRQTAECQARVNAQFLEVQRTRAAINDGDRDSIRDLLAALSTSDAKTPEEKKAINAKAVQVYFTTQKALDQQRAANPLPKTVKCSSDNPLVGGN